MPKAIQPLLIQQAQLHNLLVTTFQNTIIGLGDIKQCSETLDVPTSSHPSVLLWQMSRSDLANAFDTFEHQSQDIY